MRLSLTLTREQESASRSRVYKLICCRTKVQTSVTSLFDPTRMAMVINLVVY